MKKIYLIIGFLLIIIVVVGYFIYNSETNKINIPIIGLPGINMSDETQIQKIVSERFFSHDILGGEVSALCDSSNTQIVLLTNSIAEGDAGELIGAAVECICGMDCGYWVTYQLKKVSDDWIIASESKMSLT
tara:strand:+ start:1123 stop:1518 length:396 start_codon:yes stop_codon:yes gene_type:complete